jgi:hypothetical protein
MSYSDRIVWRIQAAPRNAGRLLQWAPCEVKGCPVEYIEADRVKATQAAATLSKLLGEQLIFRVIHVDSPRRGAFYPAPLPAR